MNTPTVNQFEILRQLFNNGEAVQLRGDWIDRRSVRGLISRGLVKMERLEGESERYELTEAGLQYCKGITEEPTSAPQEKPADARVQPASSPKMRQATPSDLAYGVKLYDKYGCWIVQDEDQPGIWGIRNDRGSKILCADNARWYQVEVVQPKEEVVIYQLPGDIQANVFGPGADAVVSVTPKEKAALFSARAAFLAAKKAHAEAVNGLFAEGVSSEELGSHHTRRELSLALAKARESYQLAVFVAAGGDVLANVKRHFSRSLQTMASETIKEIARVCELRGFSKHNKAELCDVIAANTSIEMAELLEGLTGINAEVGVISRFIVNAESSTEEPNADEQPASDSKEAVCEALEFKIDQRVRMKTNPALTGVIVNGLDCGKRWFVNWDDGRTRGRFGCTYYSELEIIPASVELDPEESDLDFLVRHLEDGKREFGDDMAAALKRGEAPKGHGYDLTIKFITRRMVPGKRRYTDEYKAAREEVARRLDRHLEFNSSNDFGGGKREGLACRYDFLDKR